MPPSDLYSLLGIGCRPVITPPTPPVVDAGQTAAAIDTHGTTVIAVKFRGGVLNVADRRATANMSVMYDRAEKVLPIDDYTLLAISGSYARSMEVIRYLRHSLRFFERSQLQSMSLDGKLTELAKAIAAGLPAALQGLGGFLPILSTYDRKSDEGRIFFYDGMGARFESAEFGAAGSGSVQIRGVFDYIVKTKGPFHEMDQAASLREALLLLDIAADLDAATGGWAKVLPLARTITADGICDVPEEELQAAVATIEQPARP